MLGSGVTKSVSYITTDTQSGASPRTFSAVSLGTADASRRIIVAASAQIAGNVTGVSVAGVAATSLVAVTEGGVEASLWIAHVPLGTSGDIVVTSSAAIGLGIGVWGAYGLGSNVPIDSDSSVASPGTATLTTVGGGFAIAAIINSVNTSNTSWTNATERYDSQFGASYAGADASTSEGTLAITATYSDGSGDEAAVFATF